MGALVHDELCKLYFLFVLRLFTSQSYFVIVLEGPAWRLLLITFPRYGLNQLGGSLHHTALYYVTCLGQYCFRRASLEAAPHHFPPLRFEPAWRFVTSYGTLCDMLRSLLFIIGRR